MIVTHTLQGKALPKHHITPTVNAIVLPVRIFSQTYNYSLTVIIKKILVIALLLEIRIYFIFRF